MGVAIALVVLVVGSVLFHFLSPWYFTPIASNWGAIDDTICRHLLGHRGRLRRGQSVHGVWRCTATVTARSAARSYEPENKKLEWWLLSSPRSASRPCWRRACLCGRTFVDVPKDTPVVEVVAQQWNWSYRLPGKDGKLGTVHARFVSDGKPLRDESGRSQRPRRHRCRPSRIASAARQAGQGAAALEGRAAQLLDGADPRQDGHGAGPGHVYLVHADAHGILRPALRGTLRHRALRDARQARRGRARAFQAWLDSAADLRADPWPGRRRRRGRQGARTRYVPPAMARKARATSR